MTTAPAGRSAKGEQRRAAIVAAAAELVVETGFGALSHRAVARRAGVPLASTTYYFTSLEELVDLAMAQLAERWREAAAAALARAPQRLRGPHQLADAALDVVALSPGGTGTSAEGVLVLYERYLEAARHPRLRAQVVAHDAALDRWVRELLTRAGLPASLPLARVVVATVDGALVRALAESGDLAEARRTVRALAGRLLAADAG
jgi:DNA-binding transcriptional regulator YbjK